MSWAENSSPQIAEHLSQIQQKAATLDAGEIMALVRGK